jgi:peptide/nickel transport system permease protein
MTPWWPAAKLGPAPVTVLSPPRRRLAGLAGFDAVVLGLAAFVLILAIVGPWIAPDSVRTSNINMSLHAPSGAHPFGTDDQGRDIFWRVVAGARYSVLSSIAIVAAFSLIGTLVAVVAALGGRIADEVLMRLTDAVMAIPTLILGLGFAAVMGPSLRSAIIALGATGWPVTARVLRSTIRETMVMPYIEGARVLGVSRRRLVLRHILPNSLVGAGPQPPSPEWGAMVNEGQGYIAHAWWATVFPGLAIVVATVAFALLGDVAQNRLSRGERR